MLLASENLWGLFTGSKGRNQDFLLGLPSLGQRIQPRLASILNPCIALFKETKSYYDICVKHASCSKE